MRVFVLNGFNYAYIIIHHTRTWDKRNNRNSFPSVIFLRLPKFCHQWSTFHQTLWQKRRLHFTIINSPHLDCNMQTALSFIFHNSFVTLVVSIQTCFYNASSASYIIKSMLFFKNHLILSFKTFFLVDTNTLLKRFLPLT